MSRITSHVGFGLTYATTFMHPFYVARLLNLLDHITNGRIAFNVITSQRKADAQNYGFHELMEHGQRYDRMDEFMDVCRALWASVEPDAFEWNCETGLVANPAKVRAINHAGRFFKVKGPLSVPPFPDRPGSDPGRRLAARHARGGALCRPHSSGARKPIPAMAKQRAEVDAALRAEGRDPEKVGIIGRRRSWWARLRPKPRRYVGELLRREVRAHVLHQRGRHLGLLRRHPDVGLQTREVGLADLVVPQQRLQHQHLVADPESAQPRLLPQRELHYCRAVRVGQRPPQQRVRLPAVLSGSRK